MRIFCLFVASLIALACSPADAVAEQRVALVIGNSAYQHAPRLTNPVSDAALLVDTFRKAGFAVVEAHNDQSAMDMRRTLRDFAAKARNADIAVIYYAGHGIEIDGNNYLVPTDALLQNDSDVYDETVGLERVLVAIEPVKRLRLVILDACRDNPFSKTMKRTLASRAVSGGLAKVEPTNTNTMVAFAAKAGYTALDGDGKNSPFAVALANNLAKPGLDLRKAFGYVRDEVLRATNNKQEPFIYGSLGGDDVVLGPEAPVVPPPAAPTVDASASRDYEFAERVGTVEGWDLYIKAHPSGFYTDLARVQRSKLAAVPPKPIDTASITEPKKPAAQVPPVPPALQDAAKPLIPPKLAGLPPAIVAPVESPAPPTEKKSVAAITAPSCTIRTARRGNDAAGGPFIPVSIRPDVEGAKLRTIAVSPTGKEIATAGDDGLIRIWDASSFRLSRVLRAHSGPVYSLDYWTDGTLLASAGWDGKVRVWDLRNDKESFTFDAGGVKQFSVAFTPEASLKYLASGGEDGYVRIWNWQTKGLARSKLDHQGPDPSRSAVRSLSYAPSGTGEFASAGFDGKIRFYRLNGTVDTKDAYGRKALRVAYSPDSTRLVSAGSDGEFGSPRVWDVKSGTSRVLVGHKDYVVSASWSADGRRIVTGGGGRDKSVNLWDADSGRLLASFAGHQEDVEAVAFFPGGNRLISASEDRTIKVWDVAEKRMLLTAVGFGDEGYVSYTPEGCYAGSNGVEGRLSVFNGSRFEPMSLEARKVMLEPAGFTSLLAR